MAGHSKWSKIKRDKAANDKQRGAQFAKFASKILKAAFKGGIDPLVNNDLHAAIQSAKQSNMPNDVIAGLLKKVSNMQGTDASEIIYEFYGLGGVGIILSISSNNKNRALSDVKTVLSKWGLSLGVNGSVAFMFDKVCEIVVLNETDIDKLLNEVIDFEILDIYVHGEDRSSVIVTDWKDAIPVASRLSEMGYDINTETIYKPVSKVHCSSDISAKHNKLFGMLNEIMGFNFLFHNME